MRQLATHLVLLGAIATAVFFTNLGGARLWDRDEPRNAGCAAEMLARGDWVTPVFDGQLRTHKPALLYWFMMSAYAVFGVDEFSARFWSAALGLGTVLCTYAIGRRLFEPGVGLWAGIVLATSLMFGVAARAATPDSVLIFFTTAATLVYVLAAFPVRQAAARRDDDAPPGLFPRSWWAAVAIYGVMGLAVLAKGPVGLVLPTAVIGMYLLIVRLPPRAAAEDFGECSRWSRLATLARCLARPFAPGHFLSTCWSMRPITAVATVLAVAGPWYLWVGLRTNGAWLEGFLLEHNVGRAAGAMEGHGGPIIYYPIALLIGLFPWSVLAAPLLCELAKNFKQRVRWRFGLIFAAGWVGVYVSLFSLASTKLPSYITPCYPGAALLIGNLLHRWTQGELSLGKRSSGLAWVVLAIAGVAILVGAPIAAHWLLPGEEWLGLVGLAPIAGAVAGWRWACSRPRWATAALAVSAVVLMIALFAIGAVRVDRRRQHEALLHVVHSRPLTAPLGAYGVLEPSWVFYARRPIEELVHRPNDTSPRAFTTDPFGRRVRRADLHRFLDHPHAMVITTDRNYERIRHELRGDVEVLATTPYFLKDETLILLGRNPAQANRRIARPLR